MKSLTREEAEFYIKSNCFPERDNIEMICDLQDIYGHQNYWDIIRWLVDDLTRFNAIKLYNLIWDKTQVNSLIEESNKIISIEQTRNKLEEEFKRIKNELDHYNNLKNEYDLKLYG